VLTEKTSVQPQLVLCTTSCSCSVQAPSKSAAAPKYYNAGTYTMAWYGMIQQVLAWGAGQAMGAILFFVLVWCSADIRYVERIGFGAGLRGSLLDAVLLHQMPSSKRVWQ
jgi:hypothetical protein